MLSKRGNTSKKYFLLCPKSGSRKEEGMKKKPMHTQQLGGRSLYFSTSHDNQEISNLDKERKDTSVLTGARNLAGQPTPPLGSYLEALGMGRSYTVQIRCGKPTGPKVELKSDMSSQEVMEL